MGGCLADKRRAKSWKATAAVIPDAQGSEEDWDTLRKSAECRA